MLCENYRLLQTQGGIVSLKKKEKKKKEERIIKALPIYADSYMRS